MKDPDIEAHAPAMSRRTFLKCTAGAGVAMMLRARGASAQGAPGRAGVVDAHCHWHPEAYVKAMAELGRPVNPNPLNTDMDQRLAWMDQHGVQTSCLTILTPAHTWAPTDVGSRLARIINDAAMELHAAHPDRFIFGVALPIQSAPAALAELNRVAGKPAFRGVHLANAYENRDYIFEPEFEPLLAKAQELGWPLLFHPLGDTLGGERLSGPAFLSNTLGNPFEHATTAAKFITTGTLDKFPTLDVILPHSGGAFPYIAGRVEYGLLRRNIKLLRPFREYLRRFHYDTLAYYPETLRYLIDVVGSDRVVIGTDNFAQMDVPEPTALLTQLKLPPADHERILRGNAMRLFKMS